MNRSGIIPEATGSVCVWQCGPGEFLYEWTGGDVAAIPAHYYAIIHDAARACLAPFGFHVIGLYEGNVYVRRDPAPDPLEIAYAD